MTGADVPAAAREAMVAAATKWADHGDPGTLAFHAGWAAALAWAAQQATQKGAVYWHPVHIGIGHPIQSAVPFAAWLHQEGGSGDG